MKLEIDTDKQIVRVYKKEGIEEKSLYSDDAFDLLSQIWKKVGWNQRYSYTFTWLGRPIIQLPEDAFRIQELIWQIQPEVIVETGVAHGGSLIYYASLLEALGSGVVIGIDIEIRPHNRQEIESHKLSRRIELIEGDSAATETVSEVRRRVAGRRTLVILDSDHSKGHVLRELEAYKNLVTVGSYIVVTDGVMIELDDVPRGKPEWKTDNPVKAVEEFLKSNKNFSLECPKWSFNESTLSKPITYWPSAWLKRHS